MLSLFHVFLAVYGKGLPFVTIFIEWPKRDANIISKNLFWLAGLLTDLSTCLGADFAKLS